MNREDESVLIVLWRESVAAAVLRRVTTAGEAALRQSQVLASLHALTTPRPEVAFLTAGYIVASATVVHAVCLRVFPALTVGHVPLATSAAFFAGGIVLAWAPNLPAAWRSSAVRRLLR